MTETIRTATFVGLALVSGVLAWFLAPTAEILPQEVANANVGTEFFPDFKDPTAPTSLRVVTYDESRATFKIFNVEFKDGLWRIPSHHNYPADAADRLARTATSIMGTKRDEFRSNSKDDHEELGVIDPLDEDGTKLKGRGQRITLSKGSDALVDLIIGRQVKNRPGHYYVRKQGDTVVYVAKLSNVDLSTNFADWVETDLLKIDRDQLTDVVMHNYSIDEEQGRLVSGDLNHLHRDKPADPWALDGVNAETEELDTARVNDMVNALDDLRLVGVRPKPAGLSQDLKLEKGIRLNAATVLDLRTKGFHITPQNELVSNQGEMQVSTSQGVVYALRFGEVFTGDELEIEAGLEADKKKEQSSGKKDTGGTKQSSRYLFVTTHFDPKLLGPKPELPALPEELAPKTDEKPAPKSEKPAEAPPEDEAKPEEEAEADSEADEPDAEDADEKPAVDKPADKKAEEAKPADEKPADEKPAVEKPALKDPAQVKAEYAEKLKQYEADLKAYEDKVKAGEEQVQKLNRRFADWYYVISADSFNKLRVSRKDLVKAKTPAANPDQPTTDDEPDAPKPDAPKPENPEPEKPQADAPKPDAPKAEAPKADAPKPDAPKTDKPEADAPKADAPKADAPKPDAPKTDDPPTEKKPAAESSTDGGDAPGKPADEKSEE